MPKKFIGKAYPNIFEICLHPYHLPSGEREMVKGQNVRRKSSG